MDEFDRIRAAWEAFVHAQRIPEEVPTFVVSSWQRSRLRLSPFQQIRLQRLSSNHLLSAQVANFSLVSIARPTMEYIFQYLEHSQCAIYFTNSAGYILEMLGHADILQEISQLGISQGGQFSEETMGTNAVSLSLLERVPIAIRGPEHYLKQFHTLDEYVAPVFDPSGVPLGTLGIIHYHHIPNLNALTLTVVGAKVIESQWQSDLLLVEHRNKLSQLNKILATISDGILVWNNAGVLIHVNDAAKDLLRIPAAKLLGKHYSEIIDFPEYLKIAIQNQIPVSDQEATLKQGDRSIDTIVSLRFIIQDEQMQSVVVTLKSEQAVRQLVLHQFGAFVSSSFEDFIGETPRMQEVRKQVRQSTSAEGAVLLRGEGGTGKTFLAGAIHNEGPRSKGPFIIFSCSSIPSGMLMERLFGYEELDENVTGRRGQPSKFELAQGGSLFIQDVDQLPLDAQAGLVNAMELGIIRRIGSAHPVEIDVRIIASTSADLEKLVANGSFRSDLYYRITVFEINIPPLREHIDDIPLLAERILKRFERQLNHPLRLDSGVMDILQRYSWPGNTQELEIILKRAASIAGETGLIEQIHLPEFMIYGVAQNHVDQTSFEVRPLDQVEMELIIKTAKTCHGNQSRMAQVLGISRSTLWRKMKAFGISTRELKT